MKLLTKIIFILFLSGFILFFLCCGSSDNNDNNSDTIPPTINHTSPDDGVAVQGYPTNISANVTDNVSVSSVILFFREIPTYDYISLTMNKTGNNYSIQIPADSVTLSGFQYYLKAVDTSDNIKYYGNTGMTTEEPSNDPITVIVSENDVLPPQFNGLSNATSISQTEITLNWQQATDNITSSNNIVYLIYQSEISGVFDYFSPTYTLTGVTSHSVIGLEPSTTYYFVVRAKDEAGNINKNTISRSATTLAVPDLSPPEFNGLETVSAISQTEVMLSWSPANDDITLQDNITYLIYKSRNNKFNYPFPSYEITGGNTSFNVSGLAPQTTYNFVVRAKDEAGNIDDNTQIKSVSTHSYENDVIEVHFVDVGQGDAIFIKTGSKKVLIDGGFPDGKVLNYLNSKNITEIDYVIATHPHGDHIGGLTDVFRSNITVHKVFDPGVSHTTHFYNNFVNEIYNNNIDYEIGRVGDTLYLGEGISFDFLHPSNTDGLSLNDASIVNKLTYGDISFLFTGDAEKEAEEQMVARYSNNELKSTVLKVGHHGSQTSTRENFLNAVQPEAAVIMCGKDNDYGHPHLPTRKILNENNIDVYRTDFMGTIVFYTDGQNYSTSISPWEPVPVPYKLENDYEQTFSTFYSFESLPDEWLLSDDNYQDDWGEGFYDGVRGNSNVLGFQHTTNADVFTVSLFLQNNTGTIINELDLSYRGRVARIYQGRSPAWTVKVNGVEYSELSYRTFDRIDKDVSSVIKDLNIQINEIFVISWTSTRGTGSGGSKQIGLSDVRVQVNF